MKKQWITALCTITLIAVFLLTFSCTGSSPDTSRQDTNRPPNVNVPPNSNSNHNLPPTACVKADVEREIEAAITRDRSLRDHKIEGVFTYRVEEVNTKFEITFSGKLMGEGGPGPGNRKLEKFLNTFQAHLKRDCVVKVHFGSPSRITSDQFEWGAVCESPLQDCNGECLKSCDTGGGNSNMVNKDRNVNPSSNSNPNTNSNSNMNTNRP